MTHDELLAKIDYYLVPTFAVTGDAEMSNAAIGILKALRAVVETTQNPAIANDWQWVDGWKCAMLTIIQAIEKELGDKSDLD